MSNKKKSLLLMVMMFYGHVVFAGQVLAGMTGAVVVSTVINKQSKKRLKSRIASLKNTVENDHMRTEGLEKVLAAIAAEGKMLEERVKTLEEKSDDSVVRIDHLEKTLAKKDEKLSLEERMKMLIEKINTLQRINFYLTAGVTKAHQGIKNNRKKGKELTERVDGIDEKSDTTLMFLEATTEKLNELYKHVYTPSNFRRRSLEFEEGLARSASSPNLTRFTDDVYGFLEDDDQEVETIMLAERESVASHHSSSPTTLLAELESDTKPGIGASPTEDFLSSKL